MGTWSVWLHGLLAAVIGGAATVAGGLLAGSLYGMDPTTADFWRSLAGAAAAGAAVNAAAYLKRSPLPTPKQEHKDETDRTAS